ncbi:CHAT domain-containing protein [Geodermatophilus sp. SYSU D00742]
MTASDTPPRPRPRPEPEEYVRLARLVGLAERRRTTRDELRTRVEPLRRGGIVPVAGELQLLERLDQHLAAARAAFDRIAHGGEDAARSVAEVDEQLTAVDWRLAEDVLAGLHEREQAHHTTGRSMQLQVDNWLAELARLKALLEEASRLDALVAGEHAEHLVLDSKVREAARAVGEGLFVAAATPLHQLATRRMPVQESPSEPPVERELRTPQQLEDAVESALARARELSVHTELVLLRTSPADAQDIDYVAILRVPRGATHTVSVRATRRLSRDDFEHMQALTARIGTAEGTRRARHIAPAALAGSQALPDTSTHDVRRELCTLGDLMYRLVIPRSVQEDLKEHVGQVTITTNEQELPWELMRRNDEHLAVRCPVARMPLGWTMPRLGRARGEGRKLRFLLWYSDPVGNLPGARVEVDTIRAGLERDWQGRIEVDVVGPDRATSWLLNETLIAGEYDVVHYAGHAAFDDDRPERSGLLLKQDVLFPADKIERLLTGQPLVFLNACESSKAANEPDVPSYLGHQSEGLASAFLYGGAVACVGSRWPVYDRSAGEFAVDLYKYLLQGNKVGEALRLAREDWYREHGDEITWATYALYGDPGFHITSPGAAGRPPPS